MTHILICQINFLTTKHVHRMLIKFYIIIYCFIKNKNTKLKAYLCQCLLSKIDILENCLNTLLMFYNVSKDLKKISTGPHLNNCSLKLFLKYIFVRRLWLGGG